MKATETLMLALVKGEHRYIVFYSDTEADKSNARNTLNRWAKRADLNFNWNDRCALNTRLTEGLKCQ